MLRVLTAYHVTNVPVLYNLNGTRQPPPDWTHLYPSTAKDPIFDIGGLFGQPCVFFSTTLNNGILPTTSVYPTNRQAGVKYWRLQVQLEIFDDYRIKLCGEVGNQRHLVMCQPGEFIGNIDVTHNPAYPSYLKRDAQNNWYTNDYSNPNTKYFVNFAFLGLVDLRFFYCTWDVVWKLY